MGVFVLILTLAGAALALLTALGALGAYLRLRRTRAAVEGHIVGEVSRLAGRTREVEARLSALDARAAQLPLRISELQQSLGTLRILTGALTVSLGQAQRALSYGALKTLGAVRIETLLRLPRKANKGPGPG